MTSSSNDVLQTPDKKTLLGAFRNLTSTRTKSPTPSSPSPAATLMPAQAAFARQHGKSASNPLSRLTRPHAERIGIPINSPVATALVESVVGGPSGLGKLLDQLDTEHTVEERIFAADGICVILDQYAVNNVLAIWSVAKDLLEDEYTAEAARAGYRLLAACVRQPALTSLERSTFFEAISDPENEEDFDVRFDILADLTNNGKNAEAIERDIGSFLAKSLESCFENVVRARKRERNSGSKPDAKLKEELTLTRLFSYIVDFTKFNSKILTEDDVTDLLEQVLSICKRTTSEADIERAIRTIDALLTYTYVPEAALRSSIEVLCDVFRQLKGLKQRTWSTLSNLFGSHLGQLAVSELLNIVREDHDHAHLNIVRGAVHVLQRLVILNGAEGLPRVAMSLVFPALLESLNMDHKKLEADVLQFVVAVLADGNLTRSLLEEDDWSYLSELLIRYSQSSDGVGRVDSGSLNTRSMDSRTTSVGTSGSDSNVFAETLSQVVDALNELAKEMDYVQKSSVMALFMRLAGEISDQAAATLISYCADERLLSPSTDNWFENSTQLINALLKNQSRPPSLRVSLLGLIKEIYPVIDSLRYTMVDEYVANTLDCIRNEGDPAVLEALVGFAVHVSSFASDHTFDVVTSIMRESVFEQRRFLSVKAPSLSFWASSTVPHLQARGTVGNILTKGIVLMFIRNVNHSSQRTLTLFHLLLEIVSSKSCEMDAKISALKLLSRLRSDANHAIFLISSSESQSLAASLCRTVETAHIAYSEETVKEQRQSRAEEHEQTRSSRTTSNSSPHNSLTRSQQRSTIGPNRPSKTPLPLWMYPGPYGLPEEPPAVSSQLLFSFTPATTANGVPSPSVLPVGVWLEFVIQVLQNGADWEMYSYILVHTGAQLSNMSMFAGAIDSIKKLRILLCDLIKSNAYQEPPHPTGLRKADVAICIFHMLSMLIVYRAHFKKEEQDDMVKMFLCGIGSGDRTSRSCIHALSLCCHELPLSLSKSLEHTLQKLSQIITQAQVAVHILEFLAGLARLPELYKNFRDEEYRTVFGICSRYLQYVRDQKERPQGQSLSRTSYASLRHSGGSRDFGTLPEQEPAFRSQQSTEELPQYVYALAYHVITFWFMSLKLQDRPRHMGWIAKTLMYLDQSGKPVLEEQGLVTIDMMHRVAYSDRDETIADPNFAKPADGEVSRKSWVVGLSLMTVETAARTGISQITRRRPSCTRFSIYRPQITQPPRHQVPLTTGLAAEVFYTSSYVGVSPEDVFQEFYAPVDLSPAATSLLPEAAFPLPEDDVTRRAISAFDKNITVDSHKIGVIYVGYQQTQESEILANVTGSSHYTSFIEGLGTLTRLKNATFNTQGLDHHSDYDGEFTYCWRDRVTEIVFHVTTMMPTNLEDDPHSVNKKRHIGNDFVNIVYNDSGLPFRFDTFPSAFNYVYVVVTPEARASFVEARSTPRPPTDQFYKVQVHSRPGFPEISPAAETKVISAAKLPTFVRLIALNASVFSLVWANREGGEHVSSWRNRLREIKRLRERYADQSHAHGASGSSPTPPSTGYSASGSLGQGFSSPPGTRESSGFRRTSTATFLSEGTNRSSILSTATEMERQ